MPIDIEILHDEQLRVSRFTARVTDADLADYASRIRDGFDPSLNSLVDVSSQDLSISMAGLRKLADMMRAAPGRAGRRVAIVASNDVAYGMSRMYQAVHDSTVNVKVFRHEVEALYWLRHGDEEE